MIVQDSSGSHSPIFAYRLAVIVAARTNNCSSAAVATTVPLLQQWPATAAAQVRAEEEK